MAMCGHELLEQLPSTMSFLSLKEKREPSKQQDKVKFTTAEPQDKWALGLI